MRHIKLFEEYSDDELKDLMGDLEGIGHKYKLTQGEDFGFGRSLNMENDSGNRFYITPETFEILKSKGILIKYKNPNVSPSFKRGIELYKFSEDKIPELKKIAPGIKFHLAIKKSVPDGKFFKINLEQYSSTPIEGEHLYYLYQKYFDTIIKKLKEIPL